MFDTKSLKPGQEIGVQHISAASPQIEIMRVKSVSPTGIVTLEDGRKFGPAGKMRGEFNMWHSYHLVLLDDEKRAEIARRTLATKVMGLIRRVSTIEWDDVPDEKIGAIIKTLEAIL